MVRPKLTLWEGFRVDRFNIVCLPSQLTCLFDQGNAFISGPLLKLDANIPAPVLAIPSKQA